MKKCLIVVANPRVGSFAHQMVAHFKTGLENQGHTHETIDLYQDQYNGEKGLNDVYKKQILDCDAICFAFPCWFEMPPFPMVAFFQTIFIEGFAYKHDGISKTPVIDLPVQLLVSRGKRNDFDDRNLVDAIGYCGLHVEQELVCHNVGIRLETGKADQYLANAKSQGETFFK